MQIQKLNECWKEGRYADLWSINHFLSGVVLGALLLTFGVSFGWSLLISLVLFVGWELVEILMGIKEHMPNMVTDVLFDMAGFLAVAWYLSAIAPLSWTAITVIIIVFMIFNVWGFIAYEERKIDAIPKKLHTHL
jgi:hypothetical protein